MSSSMSNCSERGKIIQYCAELVFVSETTNAKPTKVLDK